MDFSNVKATLGKSLSDYMSKQTVFMRRGKYTTGMHYKDGYVSMLFETIMELDPVDEYAPMTKDKTRILVNTFNKLTSSAVPSVWD